MSILCNFFIYDLNPCLVCFCIEQESRIDIVLVFILSCKKSII